MAPQPARTLDSGGAAPGGRGARRRAHRLVQAERGWA